jgi:hypothetical protein
MTGIFAIRNELQETLIVAQNEWFRIAIVARCRKARVPRKLIIRFATCPDRGDFRRRDFGPCTVTTGHNGVETCS